VLLGLIGAALYTQIEAASSYWYLSAALLAVGAGLGATITPAMAAGYQSVTGRDVPRATSALSVIQRVAGSLGTALLAVVLQRAISSRLPGFHGGLAQAGALARLDPARVLPALSHAFGATFWVALALTAAALIPALLLPGHSPARADDRRVRNVRRETQSAGTLRSSHE
jgi:hypothetical protein